MAKKYPTESARLKAQKRTSAQIYQDFWGGPGKPERKTRSDSGISRASRASIRKLPTPPVIYATEDDPDIDF